MSVGLFIVTATAGVGALALLRRRASSPWSPETWALRAAVVFAIALAVAAPRAPLGPTRGTRILVLDSSRSLTRGSHLVRRAATAFLSDLPGEDQVGVVVFGAGPSVVLPPGPPERIAAELEQALARPIDPWGSDVGAALRQAATLVPDGRGELILVSDGRDTGGGALRAAADLGASGLPVHTFAPDAPPPFGARMTRLEAPARVARGARFPVVVAAQATRPAQVTIHLESITARGPISLGEVKGRAEPGRPVTGTVEVAAVVDGRAGELRLRARVEALGRDDAGEDDLLEARVLVGRGARAVRVGPRLPGLKGPGVVVSAVAADDLAAELRRGLPDLIALHEVPFNRLRPALPALRAALETGVGLVVVGARAAFGPGGYADSPLEVWLPVTSGPGQERQRPLHLAVALDASGSMARPPGDSRYLRAVTVGLPLDRLRPTDRLAVMLFAGEPTLVQGLGLPAPGLRERLVKHVPRGGTAIGPALRQALTLLLDAPATDDRLLVLATDSEDAGVAAHTAALTALARDPRAAKVEALLIQIGGGSDASLRALQTALAPLRARVERADDADDALRTLIEGELLARRSQVRTGPFPLRLTPAGATRRLQPPAALSAFAPVRPRTDPAYAVTLLGTAVDPETDDPPWAVLGRRGTCRTLALPIPGREAGAVLPDLIRELLPPSREVVLRAERRGQELVLTAEGKHLPIGARVHVLSERPGEAAAAATLIPVGPTRAAITIDAPGSGPLVVVARDAAGARLAVTTVPAAAHGELADPGADASFLAAIAAASGGEHLLALPSAEAPIGGAWRRGSGERSLGPWAALAALLLLLLEAGATTLRARSARRRA